MKKTILPLALLTLFVGTSFGAVVVGSVFHFDAQNLNGDGGGTNPADGGAVTAWSDLSGNGRDLGSVQGTPTYRVGEAGINGKNYVEFDGYNNGGDRLNTASLSSTDMAGATGKTVNTFWLMRYNSGVVYWKWDGTNRYGAERDGRIDFAGSNTNVDWSSDLSDNAWHVLEYQTDGTNSTVYLDGAVVKTKLWSNALGGSATVNVGGQPNTNLISANVDFAEIVHYNSALSDADRNQTGLFLADKYGITTTYAIPEPSSFGLVAAFACGLVIFRRRLKR